MTVDAGLDRFNRLPDAPERLLACCASASWSTRMADGRPYPSRGALKTASAVVLAALDWTSLRVAVDAHPRIGERLAARELAERPSAHAKNQEAAWSRGEQAGMDRASDEIRNALVEANRAYEDRFGHVFLICATGRSDVDMLAAAKARAGNDDQTERAVVRAELAKIVALRLGKLLDSLSPSGPAGP